MNNVTVWNHSRREYIFSSCISKRQDQACETGNIIQNKGWANLFKTNKKESLLLMFLPVIFTSKSLNMY